MTKWTDTVIFKKFSKSKGNNFSNNNQATSIFELYLHLFIIPLYTKHHLNPSNHHWENEQKLSFSRSFLSPRAITSPTIIGQHPHSNLTCIFSWYICIPNIILIHQTINEKMNGNSFSRNFLSPRAITSSIIIGLHPYSNLTCISSWYICIPNIIWIHLTITEKMNGNCHYQECDGRTDGRTENRTDITIP